VREQYEVWDVLVSLDSETLLQTITDYHGMQILSEEGFIDSLVDKGLKIEDEDGDEEPEEPGEDDYIILDWGTLGSRTGVSVRSGWSDGVKFKVFDTEEEAVKAIKLCMAAQQFYPLVWKQDDHGGITQYSIGG
jgi:hypothetical protein